VFFSDSKKILDRCISDFEVGGVLINEVPTYRADHMPYGGVKESGLGREGLKYAMEEFSERKVVVSFKNMT
jgi:acyl-CoA reductase-like NAD-dependent aldehyde dehydrogenase